MRPSNEADVVDGFQAIIGHMVPSHAMALFTMDEAAELLTIRYAAGIHAGLLKGITRPVSSGIAGWVALNRRAVVNADPVFDLAFRAECAPALRSCVVVPLIERGALVAVLALYSKSASGFTTDHLRVLEALAPRLANGLALATLAEENRRRVPYAVTRPLTLAHSH